MLLTKFPFGSICLLIFLSLIPVVCLAEKVSGQILDPSGKPIADVTISDGFTSVFSNAEGRFSINAKTSSLVISKLGYKRRSIAVEAFNRPVILEKQPVKLPTVKVVERYENAFGTALDRTVLGTDAARSDPSLTESLSRESSVHTAESRLLGETRTISLLGNLSRHTLIVLDDVPLNASGEPFDTSLLPWQNIKRVEIVKGNASLYGGPSAIGGIVYLYTDTLSKSSVHALETAFSYGSFQQSIYSLAVEKTISPVSCRISLSDATAENDFAYQPRPWWNLQGELIRTNNRKEQRSLSLNLKAAGNAMSLQYNLDADWIHRQLPGPVNFLVIYKNAYLTGENLHHSLALDWHKDFVENHLLLWQNNDRTLYDNTRADNPVYPTCYRQINVHKGLRNRTAFCFEPITLSLDLEVTDQNYERQDLLSANHSIPSTGRTLRSVAVKTAWSKEGNWYFNQLQGGFRQDNAEGFETFNSWRLEELFTWESLFRWQAGASCGSSFSLPSFYDLYWKGDAQSLGNPDLKPETSLGGSVWTQISYKNNQIKAAWHSNRIKQLIQWRQTYLYGTVWKPLNIGKAQFRNWEFSADLNPFNLLAINSSLSLTKATDEALGTRLTYTPEIRWITALTLHNNNWSMDLTRDYTGRQWKTPDNLYKPIPALELYNASFTHSLSLKSCQLKTRLSLYNLFDKQYEIYDYVPQPGFNWLSSLEITRSF